MPALPLQRGADKIGGIFGRTATREREGGGESSTGREGL